MNQKSNISDAAVCGADQQEVTTEIIKETYVVQLPDDIDVLLEDQWAAGTEVGDINANDMSFEKHEFVPKKYDVVGIHTDTTRCSKC